VKEFDVDNLQLSLASKVKDLLKNYKQNEIRDTSHGAATFYVWVRILLLLFAAVLNVKLNAAKTKYKLTTTLKTLISRQ